MSFLLENDLSRKKTLPIGGKSVKLPIYFPSISTVKTGKTTPIAYFRVLQALFPNFLVSAYDIYNSKDKDAFIKELKLNKEQNKAIIILDSGNYERFWLKDARWNQRKFNSIIKQNICDLAFCYDKLNPTIIQNDIAWLKKSITASQTLTSSSSIVPIVHSKKHDSFPDIILELHKQLNFAIIAVPERELGDGIIQRTETITKLRKALNKLDTYIYIHVLGTGNPRTLLLFSLAGADTFDGLEWCQTVVDSKTALLYHFQQRELIIDDCLFCHDSEFDYNLKTFAHNLNFYNTWMKKIQDAIESNKETELLQEYFDSNFVSQLKNIWS